MREPLLGPVTTTKRSRAYGATLNGLGFPVNTNVAITGPLSLVINGSGTEFLTGTNTYSGSTVLLGSTVVLGSNAALPTGTALLVNGSGVLDLNGHNLSVASLGGVGTTNTITNSSSTPAVLTITGSTGGFYTGAITGAMILVLIKIGVELLRPWPLKIIIDQYLTPGLADVHAIDAADLRCRMWARIRGLGSWCFLRA